MASMPPDLPEPTETSPPVPAPLVSHLVTITTYNTLFLNGNDVYTLVTPYAGPYFYCILNNGPLNVYIRADADPSVGDPNSELLPVGCADNLILVPEGTTGLRLLAGPPSGSNTGSSVTVRLVRG